MRTGGGGLNVKIDHTDSSPSPAPTGYAVIDAAWHIINSLVTGMNIKDPRWKPATDWLAANRPKKLEGKLPIRMGGKFDCPECGTNHGLFHCPIRKPNIKVDTSGSPEAPTEEKDLVGIVEKIGQAWCLCPCEWGIDDYITIQSSQGQLALCNVVRVVVGMNRGMIRYEPLMKGEIHDLSANTPEQP